MKNKNFWLFEDFNTGKFALFDDRKKLDKFILDYTADFLTVGLVPDSDDYRIKKIELNVNFKDWDREE